MVTPAASLKKARIKTHEKAGVHTLTNTAAASISAQPSAQPAVNPTANAVTASPSQALPQGILLSGDNLPILRGMESASVDLIYLDPPFNSNRNHSATQGSPAAGATFRDAWTVKDADKVWWKNSATQHPLLHKVIDVAGALGGQGTQAYLIYMTMRLLEMQRILKPTGSLYLHCNPTMSHSLKLLLDALFSPENFKNEIIWHYDGPQAPSKKKFATKHDVILFYAKNAHNTQLQQPYYDVLVPKHAANNYQQDAQGRWFYTTPKGDYTPQSIARLEQQGRVHWTKNHTPRIKHFVQTEAEHFKQRKKLPDVWSDIPSLGQANPNKQKLGYPTQKPIALLNRIIQASSNPGEIVLDPFCGSATTCMAAKQLNRQSIGIDISPQAIQLAKTRIGLP